MVPYLLFVFLTPYCWTCANNSAALLIILFGIPWLLAVFSSAQLLWGLVELTMEKSWNEISSTTRLLLMVFIGIPLGIIVIAGIIYIAIWGS